MFLICIPAFLKFSDVSENSGSGFQDSGPGSAFINDQRKKLSDN